MARKKRGSNWDHMLWVALDEEDLEEDWFAIYREDFDHKHLYTICKEAYYHFTYGNTREEIAEGRILLIEKNKDKNRTFSIELNKILLQVFTMSTICPRC